MSEPSIKRVGTKDPNCCQGTTAGGQCVYEAVPNSKFCPLHGGAGTAAANKKNELRNYIINTEYGKRAGAMANSPGLKDLTDEIVILRATLEGVMGQIKDANQLVLFVDKIDKLASSIAKLIESAQKLQEKNKELIDRKTLMQVADDILMIILETVADPDIRLKVAEGITNVIDKRLSLTDQ